MVFDTYQNLLSNVSFGSLFFSMLCYWVSLNFSSFKALQLFGRAFSMAANLSLFSILASRWLFHGYFPLSNLYESLLFLSWTLLFILFFLENKTQSKLIGSIVTPVVLLITGFASLTLPLEMQKASPLVPALQSNWLMMHVSLMMLSYATLIIGSLLSIIFLIISTKEDLRRKKESFNSLEFTAYSYLEVQESGMAVTANQNLENDSVKSRDKLLQNIDNWSYRTITLGFPFLTIGIIAGAVWANEAWGSYWSWDPKETWALITWLVFASYLHARITKGWAGKKPAILGSIGFFIVWICYLGVNFLGQGLHSYGWLS